MHDHDDGVFRFSFQHGLEVVAVRFAQVVARGVGHFARRDPEVLEVLQPERAEVRLAGGRIAFGDRDGTAGDGDRIVTGELAEECFEPRGIDLVINLFINRIYC